MCGPRSYHFVFFPSTSTGTILEGSTRWQIPLDTFQDSDLCRTHSVLVPFRGYVSQLHDPSAGNSFLADKHS